MVFDKKKQTCNFSRKKIISDFVKILWKQAILLQKWQDLKNRSDTTTFSVKSQCAVSDSVTFQYFMIRAAVHVIIEMF